MSKFASLQGLRAISITLVLIFHLFPKVFVNGFVGVDMFFVLSGYLMTKILTSTTPSDFCTTKNFTAKFIACQIFYTKRVKRILPLYFLTIFATILCVFFLVFKNNRTEFIEDVKWAVLMIYNYKIIFEHVSYWDTISTIRYLTHLWSICVELQYYLLAPLIFWISTRINKKPTIKIPAYILAVTISYLFQTLTPFELSYSCLASRIWQFLIGHVAFEVPRRTSLKRGSGSVDEHSVNFIFPIIFIGILTIIFILPRGIVRGEEQIVRSAMSILAGIFCHFCGDLEKSIFTARPLVILGDLSYVVYLVHWPVINLVRYVQLKDQGDLNFGEALIAIAITFTISFIIHRFVEPKFIESDFIISMTTIVIFASCSIYATSYLQTTENFFLSMQSRNLQESIKWNSEMSRLMRPIDDLPCVDVWNPKAPKVAEEPCWIKSNGTGKILVIGNSLAIRAFPAIFEFLDENFAELRLFARTSSAPLTNSNSMYTNASIQVAKFMKPDLLWIVQGVNEIAYPHPLWQDRLEDSTLDKESQRILDELKVHAKLVVIDLPYFVSSEPVASNLARKLLYGKEIVKSSIVGKDVIFAQLHKQTRRLLNLNCSNCYFNQIQESLMQDGSKDFLKYDKETMGALNYDGGHLSKIAFRKYLRDVYMGQIQRFRSIF